MPYKSIIMQNCCWHLQFSSVQFDNHKPYKQCLSRLDVVHVFFEDNLYSIGS